MKLLILPILVLFAQFSLADAPKGLTNICLGTPATELYAEHLSLKLRERLYGIYYKIPDEGEFITKLAPDDETTLFVNTIAVTDCLEQEVYAIHRVIPDAAFPRYEDLVIAYKQQFGDPSDEGSVHDTDSSINGAEWKWEANREEQV